MAQHVPKITAADVKRIVQREFSAGDQEEAVLLLETCSGEEANRVRLASIKLSGGSIEQLRKVVNSAFQDYRDVIAAAEYPSYLEYVSLDTPVHVREEIAENDWLQYKRWLDK